LALHSFSISELSSDPYLAFHPTKLDELKSITPHLDWDAYLLSLNNIKLHEFNITSSHFFSNLDKVFSKTSLEDLKSYIEWQVIEAIGNYSFKELREEAFNFNGKILNGLSEQRPQFKRCISFVDEAMGDSLGELYVQLLFPGESKKVSIDLISKIMQSMQKTILNANWMDDVTKEKALLKLSKVVAKVGYPDKIHDYSELNLVSDSWLLNKLSEQSFWIKKDLAKINMATDRSDWITTAQTNNAFYNPSLNDINFPAGILQSPNFELNATLAENYGAIGATVGHELTHGFDTNGREFDEIGNLKKWWSEETNQKYLEKAKCIIDEFNQFTLVNGEHVDGANTQTENIADLGGLRVALDAYKNIEASERIDLKLFFTAYAQSWCAKNTPESEVLYNTTDYHAPMRYRVNGIVKNIPEFKDAFNCKINQPMNPENKCAIW
jgi:putative endopeptidase